MSNSSLDDDIYSNESISDRDGKDINPRDFFNLKELCYYTMVDKYFKTRCTKKDIKLMIDIIDSDASISLRVLDWFAAKFSKNRNKLNFTSTNSEEFDVRISYDSQLRTFRKKYFDPFRRKNKFYYYYDTSDKTKKIFTTIGQLNFFKWAIDKKILDFVKQNLDTINDEMKKSTTDEKKKKISNTKNKKESVKKSSNSQNDFKIKAKKTEKEDDVEIVLHFS
jgi:hypothetical protein